jgi:hypothetical protein
LRILRERGLVRSIEQATMRGEGRKDFVWALTEKGAQLLTHERGIDPKLIDVREWSAESFSPLLRHLLLTTDIHIAVFQACAHSGITLESWIDERELRSIQKMDKVKIPGLHGGDWELPIPDAMFTIEIEGKRAIFRLEIDRSTIDIDPSLYEKRSIIGKARKYMALEASQYYETEYEGRPLRVLYITHGDRRLLNMKSATQKALRERVQWQSELNEQRQKVEIERLGRRFRFLTFDQVNSQTLLTQPIWHVAGCNTLQTMLE